MGEWERLRSTASGVLAGDRAAYGQAIKKRTPVLGDV